MIDDTDAETLRGFVWENAETGATVYHARRFHLPGHGLGTTMTS
ncbi:MAG: hypothetical protein OXQ32_00180 [bacterium]|nr:hypothetical protein [bacterium]